jgi:hypothetical protein
MAAAVRAQKRPRTPTFIEFASRLVRLTTGQRVLAGVVFDRAEPAELPPEDADVARELFGDLHRIPEAARAVVAIVAGARGGKSRIFGATYSVWRALTANLDSLAPNEAASALIVAPDLRLARVTLRYALGVMKEKPETAAMVRNETADGFTIQRPDGRRVAVEALPATRGGSALRGRTLVSAVLEESAFFRDSESVINDDEVFRAVTPRVIPGGLVVLVSTPWAEGGLLFELFEENHGHPVSALVAHAPTALLRDDARTRAMIERETERDEENAAREFGARFIAASSATFFPSVAIAQAIDDNRLPLLKSPPGVVGVGADIGLVRDSSAAVAVHVEGRMVIVDEVIELRPAKGAPLKLSKVVAGFCEFAHRHHAQRVFADHHVLEPAREHLTDGVRLIACPGGIAGKEQVFMHARTLLLEGRLTIPAVYRRLIEQLRNVVSKPTSGGGLLITSPRRGGAHGDLVAALVLALHAARGRSNHVPMRYPDPTNGTLDVESDGMGGIRLRRRSVGWGALGGQREGSYEFRNAKRGF